MCSFHIFLSIFGCQATLFALLKILIAYFYSLTPKTLLFTVKISRFLAQHWNQCNFDWRLLKFGCHGNSFRSYKISDNICEFADYCSREKFLIILYRSEICTILAFFAYLVVIAILFFPWKIQMTFLNSTTPKPLSYT